jgi:tetracycline repressor-like protein
MDWPAAAGSVQAMARLGVEQQLEAVGVVEGKQPAGGCSRGSRHRSGAAGSSGRPSHSPRRQEAAAETRRRIRQAARQLFVANGYAATSIRAVAERAGVAEKTVYLAFPTKTDLLKEVAIVGDDQPIPVAERDWWQSWSTTTWSPPCTP